MEERALRFARRLGLLVCFLVAAGPESSATESLSGQREMRFAAKMLDEALAWQKAARGKLAQLLKLEELLRGSEAGLAGRSIPSLNEKVLATREEEKYFRYDIEVNSTKTRRIRAVLTVPRPLDAKAPAVVCIHGHGGERNIVYEEKSPYRGFARVLAENGFVTISTDVGQHEVFEEGRTLMGERLWDVMRCVDYLLTRKEVDRERIGCAGLSLGGEMAMWLGAMDTRIEVTVSSGFLTTVENLQQGHCPCWDFPGLTENFDFADIYSLVAPRYLQCQNGRLEQAPGGFPVSIAEKAMAEIKQTYEVFGKTDRAELVIHPGGHVFDVPSGTGLFDKVFRGGKRSKAP